MTNELKPCPFCNGVAELEERKLHAWEHGGAFAVRCSQCRMGDEGFYFSEAAVNKWNTRAIEQASQQQWIPVSERLPDDSKRVLVSIVCQSGMEDSDPLIKTAWFDLDDECWLEDMPPFGKVEAFDTWKITHWMPLPNDPKSA